MNIRSKLKIRIKKLEPVRDRYMFTDNRHPEKGIMSAILGAISVVSIALSVYYSYRNGGQASIRYAAAAFVAAIFSCIGLVLGIMSRFEKDIFKLFPNIGIALNLASFVFMVIILILGLGIL